MPYLAGWLTELVKMWWSMCLKVLITGRRLLHCTALPWLMSRARCSFKQGLPALAAGPSLVPGAWHITATLSFNCIPSSIAGCHPREPGSCVSIPGMTQLQLSADAGAGVPGGWLFAHYNNYNCEPAGPQLAAAAHLPPASFNTLHTLDTGHVKPVSSS